MKRTLFVCLIASLSLASTLPELSAEMLETTKTLQAGASKVIGHWPNLFQEEAYRDVVKSRQLAQKFDMVVNANPPPGKFELLGAFDRMSHQVRWTEMQFDDLFLNPDPANPLYQQLWGVMRQCMLLLPEIRKQIPEHDDVHLEVVTE